MVPLTRTIVSDMSLDPSTLMKYHNSRHKEEVVIFSNNNNVPSEPSFFQEARYCIMSPLQILHLLSTEHTWITRADAAW